MTSHEAASSKLWKYDVFLNYRGEDTRNGFTGHLHWALKDKGYKVFTDLEDLNAGEEIKERVFRAIEGSRVSIIVFSKAYAHSRWCLDELVRIMECRNKLGQKVLPIYYDVDPSDVRKQYGCLAEAFQMHEERMREEKDEEREAMKERIKQWREVLTEAANLSGFDLQYGHEAKFIRRIVENIQERLPSRNELHVDMHPANSAEWIFLGSSLCMEILSAACDQVSSPRRPRYALFGMVLAIAALLTCIWELIYKGRKQKVVWRERGCYMLFGSAIDSYGLVGGIAQCICSIIQYLCYIRHDDTPIKMSLLPAIFLICLITTRLSQKGMQDIDKTREHTN